MAVKKRKPTSAGRRFQTVSDFAEITTDRPEKTLISKKAKTGGRNTQGRVTSRHRGGGHKQRYRVIDFRRDKDRLRWRRSYDPNLRALPSSTMPMAKRYILAPVRVNVNPLSPRPRSGPAMHCPDASGRNVVHAIEMRRWRQAPVGRHRVSSCRRRVIWPASSLQRDAPGALTVAPLRPVGNTEAELIKLGKAGRKRWKGVRPQTRGVAMNPVDHPLGGGEGKSSGGRHPVSPWGQPEGRTRSKKKASSKYIVRRRAKKGRR
jgi:large subunit ribosomal protein L2